MKLHKIRLANVYGHRDTEIDLSDVDAAVVCGDNGAGKSTLVAWGPLYALYGTKQGDTYADVVRHGADEATASVTFEIGSEIYRVTRTYSMRTKSGSTDLELVRRTDDGSWTPEATGSVREIQGAIESLLGVDESVVRTGSIQTQGDAGRFTQARSSERIEQLASLLGVEYLRDAYTEAGRLKRGAADTIEGLRERKETVDEVRERLEDVEGDVADAKETLEDLPEPTATDEIDDKIDARKSERDEIDDKLDAFDDVEARRDALRDARDARREEIHGWEKRHTAIEGDLEDARETVETYDTVHGYETVDEARESGEALAEKRDAAEAARTELRQLQETIDEAVQEQTRVENSVRLTWREASEDAEKLSGILTEIGLEWGDSHRLDTFAEELRAHIDEADELWSEIKSARRRMEALRERHEDKVESLEKTAATIDERNDAVDESKCRDCGLLQHAFDALDRLDDLETPDELAELDEQVTDAEERIEEIVDTIRTRYDVSDEIDHPSDLLPYLDALHDARDLRGELDRADERLREYAETYQQRADARKDAEASVAELREEWELDDGDDPVARIDERLEDAREAYRHLQERDRAERTVETLSSRLNTVEAEMADAQSALDDLNGAIEAVEDIYERVRELRERRSELADAVNDLQERRSELEDENTRRREKIAEQQQAVARLESKRDELKERLDESSDLDEKLDDAKRERASYEYAREFFDAAPSLVIGSAIPRIESTANDVLDDVFPEVSVRIDRQKTSRSGTTSDKLHVRLERNGVEQPFAAFSGGEQFLVNVSIRLGLAKAASARQSGRPIRLLVVDEGFGALDPDNIERVKDALVRLAERFSQILVISHVPEVQGALGTLVRVESTADGTSVEKITGGR